MSETKVDIQYHSSNDETPRLLTKAEEHKTVVVKFGGSSLCVKGFSTIKDRVNEALDNNEQLIIVVSAIQKTTNNLMKIIEQEEDTFEKIRDAHVKLARELSVDSSNINIVLKSLRNLIDEYNTDPSIDITQQKIKILSMGEILSSVIIHQALSHCGINNKMINARSFIKSVNSHNVIDPHNLIMKGEFYCDTKSLNFLMDSNQIYVTQGFVASTADSRFCVLSRSGSDTSAAIIASGVRANRLEIWTDVNGMYTADPNVIPEAKLIKKIGYDVCQELASSGSRVLHPYCLGPCKSAHIPIHIRNTFNPTAPHTIVNGFIEKGKKIYAISVQKNITVFTVESKDMWGDYGFVHDIFGVFKEYQVDVNIITTSQMSITTTTDELSRLKIMKVHKELARKYDVDVKYDCSIVSIVANDILDEQSLNKSLEFITDLGREHLHIKHYSSNNLNVSFVVDSIICNKLVRLFHREYITKKRVHVDNMDIWWRKNTQALLKLHGELSNDTTYVYSIPRIRESCNNLKKLSPTVSRFYYAMKANSNMEIIKEVVNNGLGLECVSKYELEYANRFIRITESTVLFTPNYCDVSEYTLAFKLGALVVVDNDIVIKENPELFRGKNIGIRVDLDQGDGHNKKVITEGDNIKFGFPMNRLEEFKKVTDSLDINVVFLHSHKGSGILNYRAWADTLCKMKPLLKVFTDVHTIDLGGGLGIFTNGDTLDLKKVKENLDLVNDTKVDLVMEPGRYVVAESGIILTKATQKRSKGAFNYLGVDAGMNTLIRPALYGSYHPIYNLSNIHTKNNTTYQVVGPICESGDILGKNIKLPESDVGDVILIENTGAYGRVMACEYNMRPLAEEICVEF